MRRSGLGRRATAFAVVVIGTVTWGGGAGASVRTKAVRTQATSLGGIRGSAAASGLHATYAPKGLLPTGAPLDLGSPDALATITTGPVTFARAGIAYPGDLLANPDALLSQASGQYPSGTIPPWPFAITASSAVGEPSAELNPAPGLTSRVQADDNGSRAVAEMPGASAPAIATVGTVSSEAISKATDDTVTTRARVRAQGFDLLGLVKIDSVVTDLIGTSNAVEAKLTGTTTVVGATVLGQKVSIDSEGVHARTKGLPDLNEVLSQLGIKISIADIVSTKAGAGGLRESSGLRIDLALSTTSYPQLQALLDGLPPIPNLVPGAPGVADLLVVAAARHITSIVLAGASVSVDARPAAIFDDPVPSLDGAGDSIVPSLVSGFDFDPTTSPLLPDTAAPRGLSPTPTTTRPVSSSTPLGRGIGGFLLLALLAQPLLGWRLARGSAALLGAAGPECTEEEL